jgi:hypothetical protein
MPHPRKQRAATIASSTTNRAVGFIVIEHILLPIKGGAEFRE